MVRFMRSAVIARLLQAVPMLQGVFDSTAESNAGVANKPHALVLEAEEDISTAWSGFRQIIELWLYVSQDSPLELEVLNEQIVIALDKELLTAETGERFLCLYEGITGADALDEPQDAAKRGLRFALIVPQQMSQSVQISSDSWLNAIQEWTRRILGEAWQVYNGSWPLGYEAPAVMWRIDDMEVSPRGRASYELQKQFTASIDGRDADQEHQAIIALIAALGRNVKIPLQPEDKSYLTVLEPKVNMNANGATEGQLSVTFSRRITGSHNGGPLMQFIQHTRL